MPRKNRTQPEPRETRAYSVTCHSGPHAGETRRVMATSIDDAVRTAAFTSDEIYGPLVVASLARDEHESGAA